MALPVCPSVNSREALSLEPAYLPVLTGDPDKHKRKAHYERDL